jgi:hypothetical protein
VAEAAKACLTASPCDEGLTPAIETCITAAVAKACPEATAATECGAAKAQCADGSAPVISEAQCVAAYTAMNAAARTEFKACPAAEGGCRLIPECFPPVFPMPK